MADSSVSAFSAGLAPSAELLRVLLDISQSGFMLLGPVYGPDGTTVVDLTMTYLNLAAQRMLRQPERPAESFRTLYPTAEAVGLFAFYRDAFLSGEVARRRNNYQYDGLDGYYHLVAQRQGEVLVVNFTDGADHERTAIEEELRASQAREFEARAAAETERNLFEAVLTQSPVAIGLLQGDDCVVTTANEAMCAIWGHPAEQVVGRPLLEGVPELRGQGFTDLMREVARTRQPHAGTEVAADLLRNGRVETTYYNFVYKPLYGPGGEVLGVIDIAIEVTEQVVARRRVQELNEELAVINEELASTNEELASTNEELRASNDEFLYTNAALTTSQNDLYALNRELEARVVERTAQLQAQQHLLRQILSQIPASIATLAGSEHRYSFFNDYHRQFSGDRAVLGQRVTDVFPEAREQGFLRQLEQVYRTGEPFVGVELPVELHHPGTHERTSRYVDVLYQPLRDGNGEINSVLSFVLDSTEKVLARQSVEATAQQLRLITDALPVLIAYVDRERRYQFANEAYRAWFGKAPAELLGHPVHDVVGTKAYTATAGYMDRALAGEWVDFEATMPYREGFLRYIRTSYVPDVRDGQVLGFYSLVTDVTEQTLAREQVHALNQELAAINEEMLAANEELRDTNDRLTRTNVDLDTFVYTASHDLKAPIANIEGLLLALREQLPAPLQHDADVTQLLNLMHGSVARFQRTLVHLTDVSKLQQAHSEPAELVDLPALAESVRQDVAPALTAAGGQLVVDLADCPRVRFSPKNLRSILYNLLSNAIKYQAPGRPPRVHLRVQCLHGLVRLQVQDNGLGLDAEQQSKLFVMFRRLHSHVEGTGVGLYMVKRMVENAGGTIEVHSEPNVGSTFTVVLPGLVPTPDGRPA